ncbi:MAG: hypothetical protein AB2411_05170 [Mesobacillus sp.]
MKLGFSLFLSETDRRAFNGYIREKRIQPSDQYAVGFNYTQLIQWFSGDTRGEAVSWLTR